MDHNFILTASIIASFMAGMVALFAPCCVSILLPTYLASVFKRKTKVVQMTFIYFFGIATILLPVGLGAAALARFFQNFHTELYILGGLMMAVFGIMSFAGKGMAMLPKSLQPGINGFSGKSVFVLGIFSGAATSCCAPVLAGAMTLAVLSGTFWNALIVVFAYVFGMTFPLFLIALFWEKYNISNSRLIRGKLFEFNFGAKKIHIHSTNLVAGILFLGIGIMLMGLALSGNTFWAPETQTGFGEYLTGLSVSIVVFLQKIPEYAWGVIIIALFAYLLKLSLKSKKIINKAKPVNKNLIIFAIAAIALLALGYFFDLNMDIKTRSEARREKLTDSDYLQMSVLPEGGAELPVIWDDLGKQMVEAGVIDSDKFEKIYSQRGGLGEGMKKILYEENNGKIKITKENANFLLNMFWAFGLANKNAILEEGEMSDPRYGGAGKFASTGGWTLAKTDAMDYYNRHNFVVLTKEQQELVESISKNIYRPCCGNSTHFPDCNHGMAMLGLLELMASQGANEVQMYQAALAVNSYWFPSTYLTIAKYFAKRGTAWDDVDTKEVLSSAYSSGQGYRRILSEVDPEKIKGGGGCGV